MLEIGQLIEMAAGSRANAYAPYSGFAVGAVIEGGDGRCFTGCNVENLSFGLTQCAERVALASAVAAGCRDFRRLLILTGASVPTSPCGACRQVLAEFSSNLEIISVTNSGDEWRGTLGELLPRASSGIEPRIVPYGTADV